MRHSSMSTTKCCHTQTRHCYQSQILLSAHRPHSNPLNMWKLIQPVWGFGPRNNDSTQQPGGPSLMHGAERNRSFSLKTLTLPNSHASLPLNGSANGRLGDPRHQFFLTAMRS